MNLVPWDPFAQMESLMSSAMSRPWGLLPRLSADGEMMLKWSPTTDISETSGEFLIRAELPGLKKEDVKVNLSDGVITIEGERTRQKEEKSEKFHRIESCYGSFSRSFALPEHIKAEAVHSEYKDGVLEVHIPKSEKKAPKQIPVQ